MKRHFIGHKNATSHFKSKKEAKRDDKRLLLLFSFLASLRSQKHGAGDGSAEQMLHCFLNATYRSKVTQPFTFCIYLTAFERKK